MLLLTPFSTHLSLRWTLPLRIEGEREREHLVISAVDYTNVSQTDQIKSFFGSTALSFCLGAHIFTFYIKEHHPLKSIKPISVFIDHKNRLDESS
jgi:hypothetical protein